MASNSDVTQLLIDLGKGGDDNEIYDKLYPLIYEQLRKMAYLKMQRQAKNHTLSKTELVHETYLKMIDQSKLSFKNRNHFLAIASSCMRQILIDYARKKHAQKRGGTNDHDVTFIDELFNSGDTKAEELINIDEALERLEDLSERLSRVVEMRFFGEMTLKQIADTLEVSLSTVKRDWIKARGWLYKELKGNFEVS